MVSWNGAFASAKQTSGITNPTLGIGLMIKGVGNRKVSLTQPVLQAILYGVIKTHF